MAPTTIEEYHSLRDGDFHYSSLCLLCPMAANHSSLYRSLLPLVRALCPGASDSDDADHSSLCQSLLPLRG